MSLHNSKLLSLKERLIEEERAAKAELEAIQKEKARAVKSDKKSNKK